MGKLDSLYFDTHSPLLTMISTRLQFLQTQLHCHRRWLHGFRQRTQTPSSTLVQQWTSTPRSTRSAFHQSSRHAGFNIKERRAQTKKLNKREKATGGGGGAITGSKATLENPIMAGLNSAIDRSYAPGMIEAYKALSKQDKEILESRDVRRIAQCLHHNVRKENARAANQQRPSAVGELVDFAEVLVGDIKSRTIMPSAKAHLHLIGIFKESGSLDKGVQFWKWVLEQDVPYINVDCYGAAIELLAVDGTPLAELETLYSEALRRFPGNFASYHLSPHAVLPDREQAFTVGGIPMSLLQGILTARLLNGDTRHAYLALDTALRILPDQVPPRFFTLFLDERPVQESYSVCALALRSGIAATGSFYRAMLGSLRRALILESPAHHTLGVRAMLSITHLFVGGGGRVTGNALNEVIIAITQLLRIPGVSALSSEDKAKISQATTEVIHEVTELFGQYGAKPSIPAFNSMITNLGGFGSSRETIGTVLKEADALGLAPTEVTWRSILAVAGMFHDRGLVERTFTNLRESRTEGGENPPVADFHALVKPAHLSGAIPFARQELESFRDYIDPEAFESVSARLDDPEEALVEDGSAVEPASLDDMMREIENVKADIEIMKERWKGNPVVQDFSQQSLPLLLQPTSSPVDLPEPQLRKIYDELTTDPSQRHATDQERDAKIRMDAGVSNKSRTNVTLGQLRFDSWKMMNVLLEMSEKHDTLYHQKIDQAMADGLVPPKRMTGPLEDGGKVVSWGLSSVGREDGKDGEVEEVGEEEFARVRKEILRLRGRL